VIRTLLDPSRRSPVLRTLFVAATLLGALGGLQSDAHAEGVGAVMTSKSIPAATVALIDPESGSSSGGAANTDVRIAVGDIILFHMKYAAVPDLANHGLAGYLTEFIPPNTQVVGARIIDDNGNTIVPNLPGMSRYQCEGNCGAYTALPCNPAVPGQTYACTTNMMGVSTKSIPNGSIAQLHADVGLFFSSDLRTARNPSTAFLSLVNGQLMNPAPTYATDLDELVGLANQADVYVHNSWDWIQMRAFGEKNTASSGNQGKGDVPYRYGSPVAGPETFFDFEASATSVTVEQFNDVVGPWQRIDYPGSTTGTGVAPPNKAGPLDRMLIDLPAGAHPTLWHLSPNRPLPTNTKAVRYSLGELRPGVPGTVEIALKVLATPLDPNYLPAPGGDVNCGEVFGGDVAANSSGNADDNPWAAHIPTSACVFLNLLFDLDVDKYVAENGEPLTYTLHGKNLSVNPQPGAVPHIRFQNSLFTYVSATSAPAALLTAPGTGAPVVGACADDGTFMCITWPSMNLQPSDEYTMTVRLDVKGIGAGGNVVKANYRSTNLPAPGFTTQALTVTKQLAVIDAHLIPMVSPVAVGGIAHFTGAIANDGSIGASLGNMTVNLPAGWTLDTSISALRVGGTAVTCQAPCNTNTPTFNVAQTVDMNSSKTLDFYVKVGNATAPGEYSLDLQLWASQNALGEFETYFRQIASIDVGVNRTPVPTLDCPIGDIDTVISGLLNPTTDLDAIVRLYFNGVEWASTTSSTLDFSVNDFANPNDVNQFGPLFGGLEIRATAQSMGELESELSAPCDVAIVPDCSDGLDNDSDGQIDFPADPGCSSATDGNEANPACADGIDNDSDGDIDWPADLECVGPDGTTEGGAPACADAKDNDGDGLVDALDPDCINAMDRTERTLGVCEDGLDNDSPTDGLIDYPEDPGCHSINDDDESDLSQGDIRSRLLLLFDTSGSMNWNVCNPTFTGGDGSLECGGADVACTTCNAVGCGDGVANDSRLYKAKAGVTNVVSGFGDVEYGLMRFHQRATDFECPTSNASAESGGWQGAGAEPCGGGFSGGDMLVGFDAENQYDLLEYLDGESNYPTMNPAPGVDLELRASGTTPLGGILTSAVDVVTEARLTDPAASCRPYIAILLTDGAETCGGDPATAAGDLAAIGVDVHVLAFATNAAVLDPIAAAGGTGTAIPVNDSAALAAAMSQIVADSILTEICNGGDDDCDLLVDEGFTLFCDSPTHPAQDLCTDPGETACDGVDNNCNGLTDEGLLNACGLCGALPTEVCDGLDNDCDGSIDEGGVCGSCPQEPEICDGIDNDCDGVIDDGVTRTCGNGLGECSPGTQTCVVGGTGTWGTCVGAVGPTAEICDGKDNDCDGTIDGLTRTCGSDVGECVAGVEVCTNNAWGTCQGSVGPTAEVCNGADDDCDGTPDQLNPGGGGSCGSMIGTCTTGLIQCQAGALVCVGGQGPVAETCGNGDQDCDGKTDEGVPTNGACGNSVGDCDQGVLTCVTGTYQCVGATLGGSESCDGNDNDCDGKTDETVSRSCGIATGECSVGSQACLRATDPGFVVGTGTWGACSGQGPVNETCDGEDDDCDGATDEQVPTTGPCGGGMGGVCAPGVNTCVNGTFTCIGEKFGGAESCDNLDNDCDGTTDEMLSQPCGSSVGECTQGTETCSAGAWVGCTGIAPSAEQCDLEDDDCDGKVDEAVPTNGACGTNVGDCSPGVLTCISGNFACLGEQIGGPEVCDGRDNDCDASSDEGLTRSCGSAVGECTPGNETCLEDTDPGFIPDMGTWGVCSGVAPINELCNGDDDDCDGKTDEGVAPSGPCGGGPGACTPGLNTCVNGTFVCLGEQNPGPEVCDGIDNNCNGTVDDGVSRVCGTQVGNCTLGNQVCVVGGTGTWGLCSGQGSVGETCGNGDEDCDGKTDEGVPPRGTCGTDVGDCSPGQDTCINGTFVCIGAQIGGPEGCDNVDNDCDMMTDENVTRPCGKTIGVCVAGTEQCDMGAWDATTCDAINGSDELCNLLDDDCDGLTDEENPEGGGDCGTTDVGECAFGRENCINGMIVCEGEKTAAADEICDGLDNDCDGEADENNPEGGQPCGQMIGICTTGTTLCTGGVLGCMGGTPPAVEICDDLDNDCDGVINDGLPVGAPCGTDKGECEPGNYICTGGELVCTGEVESVAETCNLADDDCDGAVDEMIASAGECGSDEGLCEKGMWQCVNGAQTCVGEIPVANEACDCDDNDCDMNVDEQPATGELCPGAAECVECQCALPCSDSEFGKCPTGRFPLTTDDGCFCVTPKCSDESCASETVEVDGETVCAPNSANLPECVCRGIQCAAPCDQSTCPAGTVCQPMNGTCVENNCRGLGCPTGEECNIGSGECEKDACAGVSCPNDQACRDGECETSCAEVTCDPGQTCSRGECSVDVCLEVECAANLVCSDVDGSCVADRCIDVRCIEGSVCNPVTGACDTDPCRSLECPDGQRCDDGECELDVKLDGGAGLIDGGDSGGPPDKGGTETRPDTDKRVLGTGGGGCACDVRGGAAPTPGSLLLVMLVLGMLVQRRRGAR
jgi:hypothetical protein